MSPQIQDLDMQGYSIVRLGAGMLSRTITGTADEIAVSNGDGVSGNPVISLAQAFKDSVSQGWTAFGPGSGVAAISYNSATVFNTSADFTGYVGIGDKIWITQASGTKYFYVASITASTITTIANSDYSIANQLVLNSFFSHAVSPIGFPQWMNYAPSVTGFSAVPTGTVYQFSIAGRTLTLTVSQTSPGTSSLTTFTIDAPIACRAGSNAYASVPFATNNSSAIATAVVQATSGTLALTIFKDAVGGSWTNSGSKAANFTMSIPI